MKQEDYQKTLKSDPGSYQYFKENAEHLDFAEKEKYRLLQDFFEKKKEIFTAHAAYGPEEDGYGNAYIDEFIFPEEGGTFVKLYGCPFKLKGNSPGNVVFGLQLSKHLFSNFPRSIFRYSKLLSLGIVLTWLFNRKGFLKILTELLQAINHKVIDHLTYSGRLKGLWPDKWYNDCEKEIERCLVLSSVGEGQWELIFKLFARFLKLFLYIDNTYKSRTQDALFKAGSLKEAIKTLSEREVYDGGTGGIIRTWGFINLALTLAMPTSPALQRIEKRFFKELNRDKIKMDIDDRYFCLTYKSYNFFGLPYETRRAEREKMNRENHVVLL